MPGYMYITLPGLHEDTPEPGHRYIERIQGAHPIFTFFWESF